MSIKLKFIPLFVGLLLIGLGVSSVISFKVTEQAMVDSAMASMDQANLELLQKMDLFHRRAQSDLLMAMEYPAFAAYADLPETRSGNRYDASGHIVFTPDQHHIRETLNAWALALQRRLPIVETCLVDQTGQEHLRVTFGQVASPEDFSKEEQDVPYFASSLAMGNGEVHIQYPYMSVDAKKWVFSYSSPVIATDGTKFGLFHYEIPLAAFQSMLSRSTQLNPNHENRSLILDPSGLIIADSDREFALGLQHNSQQSDAEQQLATYLPLASSVSATSEFATILAQARRGESGSGWFEGAGERFYVAYRPLPTFGWSVAHIRPHHALLQGQTSLTSIRIAFVLITLLTLLLSTAMAWVLVGKMIAPLLELTHSVRKIAGGNLSFNMQVAEGSQDELGELARAFNRMLATLSQTTDSKEFTENIFGSMIDGLIVLDQNNRVQRVNKALLEILGEQEEYLLGSFLDQLLPDHTFGALMFRDLLSGRPFRAQETNLLTRDGRTIPVSLAGNLLHSGTTISGVVVLVQDLRQRKQSEEQLHFLANFDVLTKLPNRTLLFERLSHELSRAPWRSKQHVGVVHCALDRFKGINDVLGHCLGDDILKEIANRLRTCIRDGDTVARVGGDEFVVTFIDMAKAEDIVPLAEKISLLIAEPVQLVNDQEVFVTASVGISIFPENGTTPEELLKNANVATHVAKAHGKNQYRFFSSDMNQRGELRLAMEGDLRRAIERAELEVHYQPRWDLQADRIVGAEALVRWRRGGGRLVSPSEFLPLAEELGLIESFDFWVLNQVCQQSRKWRDTGCTPIRVSVNVSHPLFQRRDLVEVVNCALDNARLEPDALELELTEAIVMTDVTHSMTSLKRLRDMWIHLAVDDFGTGYSTFSHLRRLPVHVLKIDRSFIREITTNQEDAAITRAIISMAHTLKLRTTAEGVEEQAQRDLLTTLGCDEMQGYLISRPLPADEMESRFLRGTPGSTPAKPSTAGLS